MPMVVECSSCGRRLNAPANTSGKQIKCPKCAALTRVPMPAAEEEEDEVSRPERRPARPADEEDDQGVGRRRRRSRAEDDDDDSRSRRQQSARKKGVPTWVWLTAAGGVLILVGGVVAFLMFRGSFGPPAPPGYTAVRDRAGGFRVFLPGTPMKSDVSVNDKKVDSSTWALWSSRGAAGIELAEVSSKLLPAGASVGTSPEQLEQALKTVEIGLDAKWNDIVSRSPTTLDGKPALEIRMRYKLNWMNEGKPKDLQLPVDESEMGLQNQTVLLVTTDGKRVFVIKVERKGQMPDEEMLKTIRESFRFM